MTKFNILDCSDSKLKELKVPKGVKELYCENNKLEKLDLSKAKMLKMLVCSNNPLTTLSELPDTLEVFEAYNCPFTEETKEKIRKHKNYSPRKFRF
jgi:Leucine-rich repeat (LRR) protein